MMTTRKKALEGKRKRKGPAILKNYVLTGITKTARQTPSPPSSSTKPAKVEKSSPAKKKDASSPSASETNGKKTPASSNSRRKQMLGKKEEKLTPPSTATKVSESVLNFSDSTLKETLLAAVAANFNCEEFNVPPKNEEPPTSSIEEDQAACETEENQVASEAEENQVACETGVNQAACETEKSLVTCETEDPIVEEDREMIASEAPNIPESVLQINEEHSVNTIIGTPPKICLVPVNAYANKDHKYKIILSPQSRTYHQESVETAVLSLNATDTNRTLITPQIGNQQSSFNISRLNNDTIITQKQACGSSQKIVINPADSKTKGQLIPIKVVKKPLPETSSTIPIFIPAGSPPHTQVTASTSVTNPPLFYIQNSGTDKDLTALVQRNLPNILASLQKQQKVTLNRDINQCPELISIMTPARLPTSSAESNEMSTMVKTSICQPLYINTQRTDGIMVTTSNKSISTPIVQIATKTGDVETTTPNSSQMESTLSCEETMTSISDVTRSTPSPPTHDIVGTSKPEEQSGLKFTAMPQEINTFPSRSVMVNSAGYQSNPAFCFVAQPPPRAQGAGAEKSGTKRKKTQPSVQPKPPADVTDLLDIIKRQSIQISALQRRNARLEDLNAALQTKLKIVYQLPLNQQRQEELLLRILDQMPTFVTAAASVTGLQDPTADNMILPPVSTLINNEVHLGQGVWLAKPEYDKVMTSAITPSLLVRNLAVAVYGEDVLKASTVVGKNNMKISEKGARPPLSPTRLSAIRDSFDYWLTRHGYSGQRKVDELSHTTHYLGSKIQDLRSDCFKSRILKKARSKRQSSEESSQEGGPSGAKKVVEQPSSESPSQPPKKAAKRKPSPGEGDQQASKKPMLQHLLASSGDDSSEVDGPWTEKATVGASQSTQNYAATQGAKKKPSTVPGSRASQPKKKDMPPEVEEEFEEWQDVCDEVTRIKQEMKSDNEDEEFDVSMAAGTVQAIGSPKDKVQAFFDSITKQIESEDT